MKYLKNILIFLIPFIMTAFAVIAFFKFKSAFVVFNFPSAPSISIQDVVKFSRFSLEKAPSATLVGSITEMSGTVKHEPRLATESAVIQKPVPIQQGDILETGSDGKIVVNFKDAAEIKLEPDTKTDIVQTLPANLVFWHRSGTVEYKKISDKPVSVRALHLLVENKGAVRVSFDRERPVITITSISGDSRVAFNDLQNDTQVLNIEEGKTLVFNDATRRPTIVND